MIKIKVTASPSEVSSRIFSLEFDEGDWNEMDEEDRLNVIQRELGDLPEQPYWALDKFEIQSH